MLPGIGGRDGKDSQCDYSLAHMKPPLVFSTVLFGTKSDSWSSVFLSHNYNLDVDMSIIYKLETGNYIDSSVMWTAV